MTAWTTVPHSAPKTALLRRALEPLLVLFAIAALIATLGGCAGGSSAGNDQGDQAVASFSSDVNYRVINVLLDNDGAPVSADAYVGEPSLTRAIPFINGLEYGTVSDRFPAPTDGAVLVTQTGSSDPLCTGVCPYTLATSTVANGQGSERIIVLYNGGALELWPDAGTASAGTGTFAMATPDASAARIYVLAPALGGDAGFRVALDGGTGCAPQTEPVVVSGDKPSMFQLTGPVTKLYVHAGSDTNCSAAPVSAATTVVGTAGQRELLVLYGTPTAVKVLKLQI